MESDRFIIAIDLDFFYGQVEQLLDPGIRTVPFAVSQKHIIVTCSYAARKLGVKKLQLITDAKRACPDLVIINGEDLTKYRLASLAIRKLVKRFVGGGKVEKLDVTDQIRAHLQAVKVGDGFPRIGENVELSVGQEADNQVLVYPFGVINGYSEVSSIDITIDDGDYGYYGIAASSHLAAHIRHEILEQLRFTSSAGVSHNKLVAKLLSDLHKPNLQTCLHVTNRDTFQAWMDRFKVEKLIGFGYKTGKMLRWKLLGETAPVKGAYGDSDKTNGSYFLSDEGEEPESLLEQQVPEPGSDEQAAQDVYLEQAKVRPLSVGDVRRQASLGYFIEWFGERLGTLLWDLLHGHDQSPVNTTPDFPKQISIEDSWMENNTVESVMEGIFRLTCSLLRRLSIELVQNAKWARYPKTVRLSFRPGAQRPRVTKSARVPNELYDLDSTIECRARIVVDSTLKSLAQSILKSLAPGWNINVINVAVTDLSTVRPSSNIRRMISARRADRIDNDVFAALPLDLRLEIAQHYNIKLDTIDGDLVDPEDDSDLDDTYGELLCSYCGERVYSWMAEAHATYHRLSSE